MQHDALGTVQNPHRTVLSTRGGNVGEVVAGLPLDVRERELQLALRDLRQQRLLLCWRGGSAHHSAAKDDRGEVRLQHQATAEGLRTIIVSTGPPPKPPCASANAAEKAKFGVLLPDGTAPAVPSGSNTPNLAFSACRSPKRTAASVVGRSRQ